VTTLLFLKLKELRHLDISIDGEGDTAEKLQANDILDEANFWPHMISLDISGKSFERFYVSCLFFNLVFKKQDARTSSPQM